MANTVLQTPGSGETYWVVGNPFTIKVSSSDTDGAIGCLEATIPPGGGPVPHRHGREDEFFFVVEGTVTFIGNSGTWEASAESAVYIPEGVVHAFENRSDTPARLLSFFLPGGFEGYFREVCTPDPNGIPSIADFQARSRRIGEKFQSAFSTIPSDEPVDREGIFVGPEDGEKLNIMGDSARILISTSETNGKFCAFIEDAQPGAGVPPHIHFREDELFYILEGELTMMKPDGEEVVLTPGSFLYSPKGTPHAWFNRTNKVVRFLGCTTPGGFDTFFREIDGVREPGTVITTAARYDIKFLPK